METSANSQRERTRTPEEALLIFETEMSHLNWSVVETRIGESHPTVYTQLLNSENTPIQDGMGKGYDLQCLISARFESLEHAITDLSTNLVQGVWKGSLKEASEASFELVPGTIPTEWLSCNVTQSKQSYWKIFANSNNQRAYLYPLSKLDPFSTYHEVYPDDELYLATAELSTPWLRNNNGSSIGISEDEAFIHAMNEAIERYSISSHYVNCYLKRNKDFVRVIDQNSIPEKLKSTISSLEKLYDLKISILDITSELNIPTFAVKANGMGQQVHIGYGTSLFADYALERALLECQQMVHTSFHPEYGEKNKKDLKLTLEKLQDWPQLQSAILMDFESAQEQVFLFAKGATASLSLAAQRNFLEQVLKEHEIEFYYSSVYRSAATPIVSIRLLVPEFSDFSFISEGLPVVPTGRVLRKLMSN